VLFLSSCNSTENEIVESKLKEYTFRDFLNKFKIQNLPFKYRALDLQDEKLKSIDLVDTIYTKDQLSIYYGILSDTTNFFSIITLLPGDDFVPILTTYDKKGNMIDTKTILVNGCVGGPCINYCSSTSIIEKDLNIFCSDTVIGTTCDENDNAISQTDSITVSFIKGKINANGKIDLSEETRVKTKK
jgi:hypothetical protein